MLQQKQITPPYKPALRSERDLEHFDPAFTNEPVQLTPDDPYVFFITQGFYCGLSPKLVTVFHHLWLINTLFSISFPANIADDTVVCRFIVQHSDLGLVLGLVSIMLRLSWLLESYVWFHLHDTSVRQHYKKWTLSSLPCPDNVAIKLKASSGSWVADELLLKTVKRNW